MNDIYESPKTTLEVDNDINTSGQGTGVEIPDGIKGWSWGALTLNWIWAIGNKTWIGLFALVPYVGIIMSITLGIKGREWAWQNKRWDSVEHFQRVQRKWSLWGIVFFSLSIMIASILTFVALPAFKS